MEKIRKPHKPNEKEFIFTEGIDYFETSKESIWGNGDKDTLEILKKTEINGIWLNLASGDGRYNDILLKKAKYVIATDIDESALSKLWQNTPKEFKDKLKIKSFDLTKKMPFDNNSFDGVFNTGTLHLFPRNVLSGIVMEIDRILKPKGKVIIDFATDVKRFSPEGKPITFGSEPLYSTEDAKDLLKDLFSEYSISFSESEVRINNPEANPPYELFCKFLIMIAKKP